MAAGHELTLIVPSSWNEGGAERDLGAEPFEIVELPVIREGDINRHRYVDPRRLREQILQRDPDVVDIHAEPYSSVASQIVSLMPSSQSTVMYTAQNVDKRYPPPFSRYERAAFSHVSGMYPCSRLAASVVRGRGYRGEIRVVPLGFDDALFMPGHQAHGDEVFQVCLVGRFVPEKGILDALRAFRAVLEVRPSRLVLAGSGPLETQVRRWIAELGLADAVEIQPWLPPNAVAELYRNSHVTLIPSLATSRIVEQYGRMVIEAQASGTAVVSYATGALPEVSSGGAVLIAQGDWQGLSRAAAFMAADQDGWDKFRRRGLIVARDKTWTAVASGQTHLYEAARDAVPLPWQGAQRPLARSEFGRTAELPGGVHRPFALPLLRDLPLLARATTRVGERRAR